MDNKFTYVIKFYYFVLTVTIFANYDRESRHAVVVEIILSGLTLGPAEHGFRPHPLASAPQWFGKALFYVRMGRGCGLNHLAHDFAGKSYQS